MSKDITDLLKLTYQEACDFLQKKYGIPKKSYFANKECKSKSKISRTDEGLCVHHLDEDKAIMLSNKIFALKNPWEYQTKERLVYCTYLEHLLLHLLITEYPNKDKNENEDVGIGGCINFLIPNLNDIFNNVGWDHGWWLSVKNAVIDFPNEFNIIKDRISQTDSFNFYAKQYYPNKTKEEARDKILNDSGKELFEKGKEFEQFIKSHMEKLNI